jgi:hypothetical protein
MEGDMKHTATLMALMLMLAIGAGDGIAATKKKRSDFTKQQQKAFFDQALKLCRKKHGASLHDVKVDYTKGQYVCWHY